MSGNAYGYLLTGRAVPEDKPDVGPGFVQSVRELHWIDHPHGEGNCGFL